MVEIYQIVFLDDSEIEVVNPDIDEENSSKLKNCNSNMRLIWIN